MKLTKTDEIYEISNYADIKLTIPRKTELKEEIICIQILSSNKHYTITIELNYFTSAYGFDYTGPSSQFIECSFFFVYVRALIPIHSVCIVFIPVRCFRLKNNVDAFPQRFRVHFKADT